MSPQPFKEGTGGNRVKDAICPSDIWGETAIYVRNYWKKDRSRRITLQQFICWEHSLTKTTNTVAQQQQQFSFMYLCGVCVCVRSLHILDWYLCIQIDECSTVVNMLSVVFYNPVGSYFNKSVAPQTCPPRFSLSKWQMCLKLISCAWVQHMVCLNTTSARD